MNEFPLDAETLSDGFRLGADPFIDRVRFSLYREGPYRIVTFPLCDVMLPTPPTWRTPRLEELKYRIILNCTGQQPIDEKMARAISEGLEIAASMIVSLSEGLADAIEAARVAAEREREEYERRQAARRAEFERERIARAEREAAIKRRAAHLFELLKWQPGEFMKCRRDNKRSTVFGTIDNIGGPPNNPWIEITTEKKKYMRVHLRDVNEMHIRDDDERKYTQIYKAGDEGSGETEEQQKEVS